MAASSNFDACNTWQEIVAEHRKSLQLPRELLSDDSYLTEWNRKANENYVTPSNDKPGPSLASLLQHESTQRIWSSKLDSVLDGLDATGIVALTRSGKVSVQDVTRHFVNRAAIVQQATNCLSHFFPDEAMERAKQLDEKRSQYEKEGRLDERAVLGSSRHRHRARRSRAGIPALRAHDGRQGVQRPGPRPLHRAPDRRSARRLDPRREPARRRLDLRRRAAALRDLIPETRAPKNRAARHPVD